MATLPPQVENYPVVVRGNKTETSQRYLSRRGYRRVYRGKVRDTYVGNGFLLVEASDRVSVNDFVLPVVIPDKGEILTAITHFLGRRVLKGIETHLLEEVRLSFAQGPTRLQNAARCLAVQEYKIWPYELIYRRHPGGSIWREYLSEGTIAGHVFDSRLVKWQELPDTVFTPSTKEDSGHDQNLTIQEYWRRTGGQGNKLEGVGRMVYDLLYDFFLSRGLRLLDTKLEISTTGVLCDEWGTPDSSRITFEEDWQQAVDKGRDPQFYDKQPLRDWAATVETPFGVTGFMNLDPTNPEHVAFVHTTPVPEELMLQTTHRYHQIFEVLVGMELRDYQRQVMGIS